MQLCEPQSSFALYSGKLIANLLNQEILFGRECSCLPNHKYQPFPVKRVKQTLVLTSTFDHISTALHRGFRSLLTCLMAVATATPATRKDRKQVKSEMRGTDQEEKRKLFAILRTASLSHQGIGTEMKFHRHNTQ